MANSNNYGYNPLMEMLEAIANIDLGICDSIENYPQERVEQTARGLPIGGKTKKVEICERLKINQRKRTMIQKVDALKDIIQQKDETKGLMIMASLINEILDPEQKRFFISSLNSQSNGDIGSEYISGYEYESPNYHSNQGELNRSGEPQNSIAQSVMLDSLDVNGDIKTLKMPLEVKYNPSEVYIIHKGIHYCRMLLTKFNSNNDISMIRELKTKEVLNVVLSENINNEKSYIAALANNYPKSFDEIRFIIQEDKDLILKSSIFVNLAQRNIQYLYEFLVKLSNILDKPVLSRACEQSMVDQITVPMILMKNHSPDVNSFAEKITRFLNRYRQGQTF